MKILHNLHFSCTQSLKHYNSFHHCSDETTAVNHSGMITQIASSDCDAYSWRRPRSESSADAESMYMTNPVLSDSGFAQQSRRSSVSVLFQFLLFCIDFDK